jgi:hypothetical protein
MGNYRFFEKYSHIMPSSLGKVMDELADNTRAPEGMLLSNILAALSLALQDKINVIDLSGKPSPISLNFIIIAESGERKTTVFKEVFKPFFDEEERWMREYEIEMSDYMRKMEVWRINLKEIKTRLVAAGRRGDDKKVINDELESHLKAEPVKPKERSMIVQNISVGALMKFLSEKGGSAGLVSDEGGVIFNSKALDDLSVLNSIWSGDPVYFNRIDDDRSFALSKKSRLTTLIMVQPKTFQKFMETKGQRARDNGYFARSLILRVQSNQGKRTIGKYDKKSTRFTKLFNRSVSELLKYYPETIMYMSEEARSNLIDYYNSNEEMQDVNGKLYCFRDYASRMHEMVLRIAAIYQVIEDRGDKIDGRSISMAINTMAHYANDFFDIFQGEHSFTNEDLIGLHQWIQLKEKDTGAKQGIEKSLILNFGPGKMRVKDVRDSALKMLADANMVSLLTVGRKEYVKTVEKSEKFINFIQPPKTYIMNYKEFPVATLNDRIEEEFLDNNKRIFLGMPILKKGPTNPIE